MLHTPTYLMGTVQTAAYRILREHVYAVLDTWGITATAWSLLGVVAGAKNGIRQVEIARALRIQAPQVTLIIKDLTAREYIQGTKNQFDARAKLFVLSPKGKKFVRATEAALALSLTGLLEGLTEQDMLVYQKVLKTIIANDEMMKATES